MKRIFLNVAIITMFAAGASAQVTIGSLDKAQDFSILELISNSGGLRLPQLTTVQREDLNFGSEATGKAMGLQIFNTTTGCVETWNGTVWISSCIPCNTIPPAPSQTSMVFASGENVTVSAFPQYRFYEAATGGEPLSASVALASRTYYISNVDGLYCESSRTQLTVSFANPVVTIPGTQGGDNWINKRWVGAFWRDDQTGERIIASPNSGNWTASIDDKDNTGSWLTIDGNGGYDAALWTSSPGDAEDYQLSSARKTSVNGTGDILFRIGVTGTDDRIASEYNQIFDGGMGKPPRYATVNLQVGGTDYKIYCRQGESADYVFTNNNYYGNNIQRNKAVMFSPYNLTAPGLNDGDHYKDVSTCGGEFVDYPTKIGAFWQWAGASGYERRAYHPVATLNGNDWSSSVASGYWDALSADHETCPQYWRRPNDGNTSGNNGTSNNIAGSEMRQSLYAVPKDGYNSMEETAGRSFGYYADGYFDRRAIVDAVTPSAGTKSAVSHDTKDAAYIGTLFFNTNDNRSIFFPAGGFRSSNDDGLLDYLGNYGCYWNGSSYSQYSGWNLQFDISGAFQSYSGYGCGYAVRCVVYLEPSQ
ncbi:MAG: hypothetical protein LBJ17_06835 [Dysgonamonadaceae bacterium]|nr:hypothetical protein [Dysgonamonadaceae bacterium]